MNFAFPLPLPRFVPPLDLDFRPAALANHAFLDAVRKSGKGVPLVLGVERDGGKISRFETEVFHPRSARAAENFFYVERVVKFLLWQYGGWKLHVGGPAEIARFLAWCYSPQGIRDFDRELWSESVYRLPFTIASMKAEEVPPANAGQGADVQLDWTGWRLGFDLGASDRKIAAVKDGRLALQANGEPVFSEEFVWDPKSQTDPQWHFDQIMEILRLAEQKIRVVDPGASVRAIGGSSAGIYVNGRVRIASLFRGVQPRTRFEAEVAPLFGRIQEAWGGIPFRIENDGDVTALAGAVALNDGAVLGLAMGSSLAGGYVDEAKRIVGWMNELAFAPVDYHPKAVVDEWSRDRGVGANYFSQQAVGRLIPVAGIDMPDLPPEALPKRLLRVQELMAAGDLRARRIYETIGRYLGYSVALYCDYYRPIRHIEILGRVMSGAGGQLILEEARNVLASEFPAIAAAVDFYEPDEREKRHGQAVAAASLPLT